MVGDAGALHTKRWLQAFLERGHKVTVLSTNDPGDIPVPVYSIEPKIPIPNLRTWQRISYTKRIIKTLKPDLVIGQYLSQFGWSAAYADNVLKVLICWGSDISHLVKRHWYDEWMNKKTLPKFDLCIALSKFLEESFLKYNVQPDKILRAHYPVDLPKKSIESENFNDVFSQYNLRKGEYFVSIRAIKSVYNQKLILKSIPIVIKRFPGIKIVFLKYNIDKQYLQEMENMVGELGLLNSVVFMDGQPLDKFILLCRNSIGAVSMALSDGMPVSVIETMAIGVPVILGDIPPIREIVTNKVNGFLVDVDSPEGLADALVEVVSTSGLKEKFEDYNYKLIGEYIKPENGIVKIENKIYELLRS